MAPPPFPSAARGGPYSAGRFDSFCLFGDVAENVRRLFLVACKPTRRPRLRRARWSHATLRREHPARGARPAAPLSRTPVASRPRRFLPALPRACRGLVASRHGTLALGVSWFTRRGPHCPAELRSDCPLTSLPSAETAPSPHRHMHITQAILDTQPAACPCRKPSYGLPATSSRCARRA